MKDNSELKQQLEEAKHADYAKEWKTSVNDKGETMFANAVIGMQITKRKLSDTEIKQKFYSNRI